MLTTKLNLKSFYIRYCISNHVLQTKFWSI